MKLAKALRTLRILHFFNELRLIMNSIVGSVVSLFWSIVMLLLMFYVFGIIFVQGVTDFLREEESRQSRVGEILQDQFGTVLRAMITMFKSISGGDDWSI